MWDHLQRRTVGRGDGWLLINGKGEKYADYLPGTGEATMPHLHRKWRPSPKIAIGRYAETNKTWGSQPQQIRLHHSSYFYGSGDITQETTGGLYEPEYQKSFCEHYLLEFCCTNKIWKISVTTKMSTWKRNIVTGSNP